MRNLHNLPPRRPSKSARWALRLSLFTPLFAILSIGAHHLGMVDTPQFLSLMRFTSALVLISFGLVFLGLSSLWVKGTKGGRKIIGAILALCLVAIPQGWAAYQKFKFPPVTDVSTDMVSPPLFNEEFSDNNARARAIVSAGLSDRYSEITGRRFNMAPDVVYDTVIKLAENRGWTLDHQRGRIETGEKITVEYSFRTMLLAMPHQVVVQLADEGDTTFVDIRARSNFGRHDLGANADLIKRFLQELDFALIGSGAI